MTQKIVKVSEIEAVLNKYAGTSGWAEATAGEIREIIYNAPSVSGEATQKPSKEELAKSQVALLAIKISEAIARVVILEDLLSSAYQIANRKGVDTHWERFAGQLHVNGISYITPKTFKILPSDTEYNQAQPDRVAELEAKLKVAVETLEYWRNECSGNEPSISVFQVKVDEALAKIE